MFIDATLYFDGKTVGTRDIWMFWADDVPRENRVYGDRNGCQVEEFLGDIPSRHHEHSCFSAVVMATVTVTRTRTRTTTTSLSYNVLKVEAHIQQAFMDIRLCPGIATSFIAVAARCSVYLSASRPLRPSVTSSIKPEVHNVAQRLRRSTEPRPHGIVTQNFVRIGSAVSEI